MDQKNDTSSNFTLTAPVAILISGLIIAGAIVYAFGYAPKQDAQTPQATEPVPISGVSAEDHRIGPENAKLTLVEFSDLECPYCGQFHPVLKQVAAAYPNDVAWVYRHFPLTQIHKEALPAAIAAECVAAAKGNDAFWAFIDGVFADQSKIGTALYHRLAAKAGISASDLDQCITEQASIEKIGKQFNEAAQAGGQGTPFTVVLDRDGKQVATFPGVITYAQAKAQVDALLKQVK